MNIEKFDNMKWPDRDLSPGGWQLLKNIKNNQGVFADLVACDSYTKEQHDARLRYLEVLINLGLVELNITERGLERLENR